MDWFNEVFDLAAVASGAGLAGSGGAAVVAWMIRGAIIRFIVRILITSALTGIGFYFLLGALGFRIVPEEQAGTTTSGGQAALDQPATAFMLQDTPQDPTGKSRDRAQAGIIVHSPFRSED